jgi:hypothetical protein
MADAPLALLDLDVAKLKVIQGRPTGKGMKFH